MSEPAAEPAKTVLAIDFHNIPGALMRVLNCFTRRGLLIESVQCGPLRDHHHAEVLVEARPITIEQIVRELNSTVGVERVGQLPPEAAQAQALQPATHGKS